MPGRLSLFIHHVVLYLYTTSEFRLQQHRSADVARKERPNVTEPRLQPHPPPQTSPTPSKPAKKRIRVTTSNGKVANLLLDLSTSFSEFQAAIEKEFRCVCASHCMQL